MALVFGRWCVAEELPWMGLRGASLLGTSLDMVKAMAVTNQVP